MSQEVQEERVIATSQTGEVIEGKGIFTGEIEPVDRRTDVAMGQVFNIYAALRDFGNTRTGVLGIERKVYFLDEVMSGLADLENQSDAEKYCGRQGAAYETEALFYDALFSGMYENKFILPTFSIMKFLQEHKNTGAFKDTFIDLIGGPARVYWTISDHEDEGCLRAVEFANGNEHRVLKSAYSMSSRFVWLEPKNQM